MTGIKLPCRRPNFEMIYCIDSDGLIQYTEVCSGIYASVNCVIFSSTRFLIGEKPLLAQVLTCCQMGHNKQDSMTFCANQSHFLWRKYISNSRLRNDHISLNMLLSPCIKILQPFCITDTSQWARWRPKSPAFRLSTLLPFFQAQIKKIINAPHHGSLWGEFTGGRWIPRTEGQLRGKCFHLMTASWVRVEIQWEPRRPGCGTLKPPHRLAYLIVFVG